MKKQLLFMAAACWSVGSMMAQSFTNSSLDLPQNTFSGGCVAVTDMNGDGYDDILTLDNSSDIVVFYQNLDGVSGLTMKTFGSVSNQNQWGMAVADINNDGHKDVFSGGSYDGVYYCQITDPDTHTLVDLDMQMFMQCANIADINNDGWLDAFGCHDDAVSQIWTNSGDGALLLDNDAINMETTPVSDNSGNYGSVWSDFDNDNDLDLFIAKCRQFVNDPQDPRRINAAFINDGENNYSDEALARGLVVYEQSWTVDFADIDNDGDFDCLLTNHSTNMMLLENDGKGYFTDISQGSGIDVDGFFLQAKMVDFDNDGYVDLLTSGGAPGFYRNNGDNTFTDMDINSVLPSADGLHSFGLGDLNKDGYLDIFASYGNTYVNPDYDNPDKLWMNDGGVNNWIGFDLDGVESNKDAVGAKIQIYGDFGTQIREVRSGESYGITNSNMVHFGLGTFTAVDYAVIKWPSGNVTVIEDATTGAYNPITEASCSAADVSVEAASLTICEGTTTTLSTTAMGTVLWSNGMIGSTVEATGGNHSAVVVMNGCAALSNTVCVEETDVDEVEIIVDGELNICEGETVTLSAPGGTSFMWSNDATEQSLEVSEAGVYSVSIGGICDGDLISNSVEVSVNEAPDSSPLAEDITTGGGTIELTATGTDLVWFADENGENIIGEGSPISVDITSNTTVYVANQLVSGAVESANGGKQDISLETGQYHDNNGNALVFTANEDLIIKDVTVYSSVDADRTFIVYGDGGTTIAQGTFPVTEGESVIDLNFFIPAGEDYVINVTDNNPQLWRDGNGSVVDYPYELGDLGAITGTTINGMNEFNFYYFFYDWNVETPSSSCYSELVPVSITVTGIEELDALTSFSLFPNPVSTELRYEYNTLGSGELFISLTDNNGREVLTKTISGLAGDHQGVLNLTEFAPGVYTFTIVENNKVATQKLVIE